MAQATPPQAPAPPPNSINVNTLGLFLDGWADLVEGMGDKAAEVRNQTQLQLASRNMPEVRIQNLTGYVSLTSPERRHYTITTTAPGATTAIYIGKHGTDLYVSWKTWLRPVINWRVVGILGGAAGLLGLISSAGGRYFYFGEWLGYTIGFSILGFLLIGVAGRIFKGSFLGYFFVEPNMFDAEDITAMSLSVHKSLQKALDKVGIDTTMLRRKQDFKSRRGESI